MDEKWEIAGYAIGHTIGRGAFSRVKLGTHLKTQEHVAIKILKKDKLIEDYDVQSVTKQLFIMKTVRHPHIIKLYQILETQKYLMFIMEYVKGGDLFTQIVKQGMIREEQAKIIFQQLISSIEYLHKRDIVHRDIKPQNMLVSQHGIKLIDFGLSNTYSENLTTMCGSLCYAAPQMFKKQPYDGKKADIWSCGVVLYVMLCGCLPFQSENAYQQHQTILKGRWQTPTTLSAEAQDLIDRLLTVNIEERYTIEQIYKHPWMKNQEMLKQADSEIDMAVMEEMQLMGYDTKMVERSIDSNQRNELTTAYQLLAQKNGKITILPMLNNIKKQTRLQNNRQTQQRMVLQIQIDTKNGKKMRNKGTNQQKNKQNICPSKTNSRNNKQTKQLKNNKNILASSARTATSKLRFRQISQCYDAKDKHQGLTSYDAELVCATKDKRRLTISTQLINTGRNSIKAKKS